MSANSIFSGPITHLLSMLYVFMTNLPHTSAKTNQKRLRVSNSALFLVVFKRNRGSEGVKVPTGTAITAALQMASLECF